MHKLLERQLKKYYPSIERPSEHSEAFANFCEAINQAYVAHEDDRELLERALELSSKELTEKNQDLLSARNIADAANKSKSSFLANMSHEMRTPLNAIIGYSELLIEEMTELTHEEIALELEKIKLSGNHLLGLINNVLDLAKIESGHMEVNLDQFDLNTLVKEACTILQTQALKNNNKLECVFNSSEKIIKSDRAKVRQIIINLAGNALKFTRNGQVKVSIIEASNDHTALSIEDNGIGIQPEKLKTLFQPFVQAEADTQKKFGGTGLGLAISAKFADLIGATLSVQSEPEVGTQFLMNFGQNANVEHKKSANQPPLQHKESRQRNDVGRRILLIDDDATAIDLMRRFLGRQGFECVSLKNGLNAVEEAIKIQPVAILLDVFMPELDGWTTLSKLKDNAATADIPVIFTTMTDERSLGLSLGALDYFTKPIDWSRLSSVLSSIGTVPEHRVVLITETEPTAKEGLVSFFKAANWEIVEVVSTTDFLQCIEKFEISLVLLDCMNKNIDQNLCIHSLRNSALNSSSAILFCATDKNQLPDTETLKNISKLVITDEQIGLSLIEQSVNELFYHKSRARAK